MDQEIKQFLDNHQQPAYRLKQFNQYFYQQSATDFSGLTTWSKDLRQQLIEEIPFSSLIEDQVLASAQADVDKALLKLRRRPELMVETVLMKHQDGRRTVCISCMVGCPVGCKFCATGQLGWQINLTAAEIVDQVLFFGRRLAVNQEKITNIVFMGMGEPMLNLAAVEEAIKILTDPDKMAFGKRRITISTAGYVTQLAKFLADGFQLPLAISLHAPTQELRAQLMPVAKIHPLPQLFDFLAKYWQVTNKEITFEYILLAGINDQLSHAQQLAGLLKGKLARVNLIPNNPVPGIDFRRPNPSEVSQFSAWLTKLGIKNTIRVTMGDDIQAACGQLAAQKIAR